MQHHASDRLVIDGTYGEGGGQILRTALSLAAVTGRPTRIENIRGHRPNPGLAAQHLAAVHATAAICRARVEGAGLGSLAIDFRPQAPVRPGTYRFDVAAARQGGSAGSASLVFQTIGLPLALAPGHSQVTIQGGTHMPWSPPYDYLLAVWLPVVRRLGLAIDLSSPASGWYPIGKGEIAATIDGFGAVPRRVLLPLQLSERGRLVRIRGRALAANLPAHIPQRMVDRARSLLQPLGVELGIVPERVRAACSGAGIFLAAEYENVRSGFSAIGERGKPSEAVAEEAVSALYRHFDAGAAMDAHLADQILIPLALASAPSTFSTERATRHLETNAWVIGRFGLADIRIEPRQRGTAWITVVPSAPA